MHATVLSLAGLLWAVGCGEAPSTWPVAFDLVAGVGVADSWTETQVIELASPRGRRHLISGWTEDRWDRQRRRGFVANRGPRSVLRFEVIEPRPLTLRFHAGPTDQQEGEAVQVEVGLNGYPVGGLRLEKRPRRHRIPVGADLLRVGTNELTLKMSGGRAGTNPKAKWYQIEMQFGDGEDPLAPFIAADGDAVMMPFGTRLEYTLQLPQQSVFVIDRLQYVGPAGGELKLRVEEDGRPPVEHSVVSESTDEIAIDLAASAPRIVRLALSADHPAPDPAGGAGILLSGMAIHAPPKKPLQDVDSQTLNSRRFSGGGRPNILLYVVDTLRADHLGIYGYDKPVSPALDDFAEDATVFDNAIAQSSWTRAAMASIFTGLWPVKHATNGRKDILDPGATTLAEILSEAGYLTAAKVRNWNVFPVFGFRQGFQDFQRVREGKADRVNRLVEGWLRSRPEDQPFFLWVHTVDPHEPYRPPESTRELFLEEGQEEFALDRHPAFKLTREMSAEEQRRVAKYLLSLYDGEIAFNDRAFGELVDLLEELELLDSTVVIFVSDHGEEFLDHGTWGHGRNLYAENLNVPLVIRFPDRGHGRRVAEIVQQIDLLPSLLEYVGLPVPPGVEGRSFLPLTTDKGAVATTGFSTAFSFLHLDGAVYRSLVDDEWKLVQRLDDDGSVVQTSLFHRIDDPVEASNLILENPIRARFMELNLQAKMAEGSVLTTSEAELDEETENALKALGYLQ